MKLRPATRTCLLICAAVIGVIWAIQGLARLRPGFDLFARLEWMTYDWRARLAARRSPPVSTRLGLVFFDDDSIRALQDGFFGSLPYHFGLYWPRQVHGRLVNELAAQGATAVAFDVLFGELRPDHPPVVLPGARPVASDDFFAAELHQAGNVVLAAERGVLPHDLFRTNAAAVADVSAPRDADGILRRLRAYDDLIRWHPLLEDAAQLRGWDLPQARLEANRIVFPLAGGGTSVLTLRGQNEFDQAALFEELSGRKPPADAARYAPAFQRVRCWQMGIVLAARALHLDLDRARVEPDRGRIVLSGPGRLVRVIPVDARQRFYIDWCMTLDHPALTKERIESLLVQYESRQAGRRDELTNRWKDKLVVVGSTATGNDLADRGATPLEKEACLVSQQWNVANALLNDRFVRPPSLLLEWALALALGVTAGLMTWNWRILSASAGVFTAAALYSAAAAWAYVQWRWWLPIVLPVGGAMLLLHVSLVTFQVLHEQRERRRIQDIFGRVVSPNVRDELLEARQLALGGVRRQITVLFADIRGFTQLTDACQAAAEEQVRQSHLAGPAAQDYIERQSQEVLSIVNLYLAVVADCIKKFDGTLDKYIGDCVMAFWGAPAPNDKPAANCVRAMIEAQQTIQRLNRQRAAVAPARAADASQPGPDESQAVAPLPLLEVGIGINTGLAMAGLIGSERHIFNYTVFGREVNLACRLEELAGPGRILITASTFQAVQQEDPSLAALCREQPPVIVKGLRTPVRHYEVKWSDCQLPPVKPEA